VVILGRPNVGKSTLFNRICGRRRALVGDEPGMTRDRLYAPATWLGKPFEVIDTGGMIPFEKDLIPTEIIRQAQVAIEEAAQLILVVDARQGIVPLDEELVHLLRRTGKPLSLAVNKVDAAQHSPLAAEFHGLGIPDIFPLSAEHGLGVDDLLEHVTKDFAVSAEAPEEQHVESAGGTAAATLAPARDQAINVAIIGRPNVGKSTLLNSLLQEERSIVSPLPGTTRDAVDAQFERDGLRFRFIVIQARKHLERADVALLMLDGPEGIAALDTHIGGYAHESRRSVIIVVNKWDLVKKGPATTRDYIQMIRGRMKFLAYAPIVFISALAGQKLGNLLKTIAQVAEARRLRVSTSEMNQFLKELDFERAPTPAGKPTRVYYLTQGGVAPPVFVAFTNRPGKLHFSFERFLENRIRERFGFMGTPIIIKPRQSR
jgi:GTP-binding protein